MIYEIWAACVIFNWFMVFRTAYSLKSELNVRTGTVFILYGLVFSMIFGPIWSFFVFYYTIWIKNAK